MSKLDEVLEPGNLERLLFRAKVAAKRDAYADEFLQAFTLLLEEYKKARTHKVRLDLETWDRYYLAALQSVSMHAHPPAEIVARAIAIAVEALKERETLINGNRK